LVSVAVKVLNSNTANLDGFYKEAQIMAYVEKEVVGEYRFLLLI
jgi:hypothetical protein